MPEFAIDLPASGSTQCGQHLVATRLWRAPGTGLEPSRVAGAPGGQWQLDHAAGVAPAQIIFSGFKGDRTANAPAAAIPASYQATFPHGVNASSKQDGWTAEWQLPTRWFTLTGKTYSGSDLRWFFGGQLYSFFNDAAGLTNTATVASEDGASNIILGTNASGHQVVAPSARFAPQAASRNWASRSPASSMPTPRAVGPAGPSMVFMVLTRPRLATSIV